MAGAPSQAKPEPIHIEKGERIAIIGNTFAERMHHYGYFETFLQGLYPDENLIIRNLGWSADEVDLKPREDKVPVEDDWLSSLKPDTIIACFGLNESYDGIEAIPEFEERLEKYLDHLLDSNFNGKGSTQLILVSPIAYEQMSDHIPDAAPRNEVLGAYTEAMKQVAARKEIQFIDLFNPTLPLMEESVKSGKPLTINGIHLNRLGYWHASRAMAQEFGYVKPEVEGDPEEHRKAEDLRALVNEKNRQFFYRYRPLNSCYIWGQRKEPFGVHNFPEELQQWEEIVAGLDSEIWKQRINPAAIWYVEPEYIEEGYEPYEPSPILPAHKVEVPSIEETLASFTVADDYEVSLYASEEDFPISSPMAMEIDDRGRIWISNSPTYPHLMPGHEPNDSIVILEDTDKDGRADKHTVFASGLYIPTGFAIGDGGAYIAQQPDLLHFKDTDGDGTADLKKTVLHGFGNADSHHSISAFCWEPGGGFYMHEGVFLYTGVETPWGPFRAHDASVLHYFPKAFRFDVLSHCGYANPWGHVVDRWGQSILNDASGGRNHFFAHHMANSNYPHKNSKGRDFFFPARPAAGVEIISSKHFPEEVQGSFVVNNTIGFHGTFWRGLREYKSGLEVYDLVGDMLQSSLESFRPVSIHVGPDGAVYILDFSNPIIGHMQYSLRDERRDHAHGRIWRITHKDRPLSHQPEIDGQPIADLLDLLNYEEIRVQKFVRRELQERDAEEVLPALDKWLSGIDPSDPTYEHSMTEALWIYQGLDVPNLPLLKRVLSAEDYHARAAGGRVLRYWITMGYIDDPIPLLTDLVQDSSIRVRLEGILACGFVPSSTAAGVALMAAEQEVDEWMEHVLKDTLEALKLYGKPKSMAGRSTLAGAMTDEELLAESMDHWIAAEMLNRPTIPEEQRREALDWYAQENGMNRTAAILDLLVRADIAGKEAPYLERLLIDLDPETLKAERPTLENLVEIANTGGLRQTSIAALLKAGGSEPVKVGAPKDLLSAITLLDPSEPELSKFSNMVMKRLPSPAIDDPGPGTMGRYLRIDLPDGRGPLTLAEVEILASGENIAPRGTATQSSIDHGGKPERAIDGNKDGTYANSGQTHTAEKDREPWWEIDLGSMTPIETVILWNRTDCCSDRLKGFRIQILDDNRDTVWERQSEEEAKETHEVEVGPVDRFPLHKLAMKAAVHIPDLRPKAFERLAQMGEKSPSAQYRQAAKVAMNALPFSEWPEGFDEYAVAAKIDPEKLALGKEVYFKEQLCATCHQPNGMGMDPAYPPLFPKVPWVNGDPERLIKIALNGLQGGVRVNGKDYNSAMAPLGALVTDEEAAAVLSYVRTSFGKPLFGDRRGPCRQGSGRDEGPQKVVDRETTPRGAPTRGRTRGNARGGSRSRAPPA